MYDDIQSEDLTERSYNLTCKLKFFLKTVQDPHTNDGKPYERKLCLLVPQEADERTRFLMAWLPEVQSEYYELGAFISYPVDSPCRLSIHRAPDEKHDRHYLFVMTKGVEDVLVRLKEDTIIRIKTLPASADSEIDHARDTDLDIEVKA